MDQFDPKDALQYDNWDNTDLNRILSEETYYSPSEKDTLLMSSSSSSSPVRSRSADLKRSPGTEDDIYYELNRSTYLKKLLTNIKKHLQSRRSPVDEFIYLKIEKRFISME